MLSSLLSLGRALRGLGDTQAAVGQLEEALALARAEGRHEQLRSVLVELSDLLAEQGELARAYALSRQALDTQPARNHA